MMPVWVRFDPSLQKAFHESIFRVGRARFQNAKLAANEPLAAIEGKLFVKESSQNSVFKLRLSPEAFAVVIDAIHILSTRTQRFETFATVVDAGTHVHDAALPKALQDLRGLMPIDGDIMVYLRFPPERFKTFERFRTTLASKDMNSFGIKEAALTSTLLIAPRD